MIFSTLSMLLQDASNGDIPQAFAYMAVGWAVAVTTGVSGLVLSGKLVMARELEVYKALYTDEKERKEKVQVALDETNEELRLQNKTLAATVEVLQKSVVPTVK